jgi:hypothetical protein
MKNNSSPITSALPDRPRDAKRRSAPIWGVVAMAIFLEAVCVWYVSAGTWTNWPPTSQYYQMLADSFLHGRVDLLQDPDPALLALPNPYSEAARVGIPAIWDASLYQGRYYLYWGPAPAILAAAVQALTGWGTGDNVICFLAISAVLLFSILILARIQRIFFPFLPGWLLTLSLPMIVFGSSLPWMLIRPKVYEADIAAGQAFLLAGIYCILPLLDSESKSVRRLWTAGILWSMCAASRMVLAGAVGVCVLLVLVKWIQSLPLRVLPGKGWAGIAALWTPLLLCTCLLAGYDQIRFGSPLETGFRYQLNDWDFSRQPGQAMSINNVIPNLYNYALNPLKLRKSFPFLTPMKARTSWAGLSSLAPQLYNGDQVAGMVWATPFHLFAGFLLFYLWQGRRTHSMRSEAADIIAPNMNPASRPVFWLLLLAALASLLPITLFFFSAERYLMDGAPLLTIVSVAGAWTGYVLIQRTKMPPIIGRLVFLLLLGISALTSLLFGMSAYQLYFQSLNPGLYAQIAHWFGG